MTTTPSAAAGEPAEPDDRMDGADRTTPGGAAAALTAEFTPGQVERGRALRRSQTWPLLAGRAAELVLLLALALTGAGALLVEAVGGPWWARVLWGALLLAVLGRAVALPFSARVRVVRGRFGLVTQSWAGWWLDVLRGTLVSFAFTGAALAVLYALARAYPDHWWVPAAAAAAAAAVVLSWLAPLLLEPVFNRFSPMPEGELRTALLALARRDGIAVRDVLVADASRRTTALNAYVSGFGATRRIVVYDTLLTRAQPREVELIVAHELGHVKHRDVLRGTLLGAVGMAVWVCLAAAALRWERLLGLAGVEHFAQPGSLPLLAALAALSAAAAGPVGAAVSRAVERRADRHALRLTDDPEGFALMQRNLAVANVSDVDPPRLLHLLFGTHPTAVQRIAAARQYAARLAARPARG